MATGMIRPAPVHSAPNPHLQNSRRMYIYFNTLSIVCSWFQKTFVLCVIQSPPSCDKLRDMFDHGYRSYSRVDSLHVCLYELRRGCYSFQIDAILMPGSADSLER